MGSGNVKIAGFSRSNYSDWWHAAQSWMWLSICRTTELLIWKSHRWNAEHTPVTLRRNTLFFDLDSIVTVGIWTVYKSTCTTSLQQELLFCFTYEKNKRMYMTCHGHMTKRWQSYISSQLCDSRACVQCWENSRWRGRQGCHCCITKRSQEMGLCLWELQRKGRWEPCTSKG